MNSRDRRIKMMKEDEARRKYMAYITGWKTGAAFLEIPTEYAQDSHFNAGWAAGRIARKQAANEASEVYGYKEDTITLT